MVCLGKEGVNPDEDPGASMCTVEDEMLPLPALQHHETRPVQHQYLDLSLCL